MNRTILVLILLSLSVGLVTTSASADVGPIQYIVSADTYVDVTQTLPADTFTLQTAVVSACDGTNNTSTILLRWDNVSAWKNSSGLTALLTLELYMNTYSGPGPLKFSLYKAADDWEEATLTWANRPADLTLPPPAGDVIQTIELSNATYTGLVYFGSASDPNSALAEYIKTEAAGDGKASFALNVTNCPGNDATYELFYDKDPKAPPPNSFQKPSLALQATTAVTMSTFRSADPAVNWPLIAGLGALAAVVIGGLAVSRRRAAWALTVCESARCVDQFPAFERAGVTQGRAGPFVLPGWLGTTRATTTLTILSHGVMAMRVLRQILLIFCLLGLPLAAAAPVAAAGGGTPAVDASVRETLARGGPADVLILLGDPARSQPGAGAAHQGGARPLGLRDAPRGRGSGSGPARRGTGASGRAVPPLLGRERRPGPIERVSASARAGAAARDTGRGEPVRPRRRAAAGCGSRSGTLSLRRRLSSGA